MVLEIGQILRVKDLAEFFCVKPNSFITTREKKLEELKEYADYEISYTKKGNFRHLVINEVYCDTYMKTWKDDLLKWLQSGNRWAETGEMNMSNSVIVTNYYCYLNNIPYDGRHHIYVLDEGDEK